MERKDLFIGYFPGCVVVADRSTLVRGDYKTIARISHAGNVEYTVPEASLPAFVHEAVQSISKGNRAKFDKRFEEELSYGETHPVVYRLLEDMLDTLTPTEFRDFIKKDIHGIRNRCLALREIYTARC